MAELLLKIGTGSNYEDGDILCATNWRAIRCEHASRICDRYKRDYRQADGLIRIGSLAERWFRHTHQYRYERVSRTQIRRVNQWTGSEVIYGSKPIDDPDRPGTMIHCHVEEFFARRLQHNRHVVCGAKGSEVYYSGLQDYSHAKLNLVWADIETQTGLRDVQFPHVPLSQVQLKRFLVLPVDDFDDVTASELTSSLVADPNLENPTVLKKRKYRVDWRALFPLDIPPQTAERDVLDKRRPIDARKRAVAFSRVSLVSLKTVV